MFKLSFETILVLAGIGQLALSLSSLAIPFLLGWREELSTVKPLTRNVSYYPSAAAAEAAGFRPCLRCRPETAPFCPACRTATRIQLLPHSASRIVPCRS